MLHRSQFFTVSSLITEIPVVESIGFEASELPKTPAQKIKTVVAHESSLPKAPKKKEPVYSTKYLVVFLQKGILGAIENQQYVYTFYNINLPAEIKKYKSRKGDKLIPLGDYYILRHELKNGRMFMILNYPGIKDAEQGLKNGLIDKNDYNRIVSAQKAGKLPPFNTALGGPVVIRGDGKKGKKTLGNIAITPTQMQKIWSFAPRGTPIRIVP